MIKNLLIDHFGLQQLDELQSLNPAEYDNIFVFCRNIYDQKAMLTTSFLEIVEQFYKLNSSLQYKNILVIPDEKNKSSLLNDNLVFVLWFTGKEKPFFDKDRIREKHIWKDVEWGKRKKNYSDSGKDPSNVWIPTLDDGKGKITEHIYLGIEGAVERIIKGYGSAEIPTEWHYLRDDHLVEITETELKVALRASSNAFLQSQQPFDRSILLSEKTPTSTKESKIIFGTSENMPVDDRFIDVVITSPPYWNLKDYFKKGQIGQESYEEYLERLMNVWSESKRVLKDSGLIWININIRTHKKEPYFIPTDYIYQMKQLGFHYRDVVIWHKSSSIPTNNANLSDKFEVFLCFSKGKQLYWNEQAISNFVEYKNDAIRFGSIWNINRKAGSVGKKFIHPAIYPTELIERIIQLNSMEQDFILDPFLGSSTTGIASLTNNRKFIGIEFNEGFYELMRYRLSTEAGIMDFEIDQLFGKEVVEKFSQLLTNEE